MAVKTAKPTRKELLKGPDEFITFTAKMVNFARENQNKLFAAGLVILAAILLFFGVRYYLNSQEESAQTLLEAAQADFAAARVLPSPGEQLALVDEKFSAVLAQYPRTDAAKLALVARGNVRLARGETAAAIQDLSEAQKAFGQDPIMAGMIKSGMAYAYEEQKDYAKALEIFSGIAESPDGVFAEDAALAIPRLYEALGRKEEARKAYESFADKHSDSPFAGFAREQAARLG